MKGSNMLSDESLDVTVSETTLVKKKWQKVLIYGIILASLGLFMTDTIYRLVNNISYSTRESCLLFKNTSKAFFLFYENFVELWLVMLFGTFFAVVLNKYFSKYGRFYPKEPISAFLYASLMPVCACSAIPILTTLKGKLRFRTIITFVLAAPLLSPIIILLSFSVLGVKYGLLRIACSFVLAVGGGYFLELFYRSEDEIAIGAVFACNKNCKPMGSSVLDQTWDIVKKLLPYILIAGGLACIASLFEGNFIRYFHKGIRAWYGRLLAVFVGIPLYVCNGADIFLLKPLTSGGLSLPNGPAIAFSLSASAICVPSIVLLSKLLGKKLTFILTVYIAVVCLGFAFLF